MTDYPDPFLLPSREKEARRAVVDISCRDVTLAYWGLHQMGKRRLVDRISEELQTKGLSVINVCVVEDIEEPILCEMCRQLKQCGVEFDDEIKESAPDPIYGYIAMIEDALRHRDKGRSRIVIILRNFDRFTSSTSILRSLIDLFDDPKGYGISIILSMTKALEMIVNRETAKVTEVPGRFYSENRRQIKPYMEQEVLDWCKSIGMGEEDGRKVWHLSMGHPYLMREAAVCLGEKPRKGWADRFKQKAEEYYGRLEAFLAKIGIDSGGNQQIRTLLDAVIHIGKHGGQASKTAEIFLRDYGLLIDGQIACADVFWENLQRYGQRIDPGREQADDDDEVKKTRQSGGRSKYRGQIRKKKQDCDAIKINDDGRTITLGGESFKVTSKAVWDFLDRLLFKEKEEHRDKWIKATGRDSNMFRGSADLVKLKNWLIFENEPGSKTICKARFKRCMGEMPDSK